MQKEEALVRLCLFGDCWERQAQLVGYSLLGAPASAGRGCTLKRALPIAESVSLKAPTVCRHLQSAEGVETGSL